MNLTLQSRIRVSLSTAMVILALLLTVLPTSRLRAQESLDQVDPISASPSTDSKAPVEELFKQLDSPSFKEREAATEKLIDQGPEILKPLAVRFFSSSSEAGWRIHRILEGIGKVGNEEEFLKSAAIIQLLYGTPDPQSQARLAKLQFRWMASRRTEAARKLGKIGFNFASSSTPVPADVRGDRVRLELMIREIEMREIGGFEIATAPTPDQNEKAKKPIPDQWVNPRLDRQASILKAEKIINGSAVENRKLFENTLDPSIRSTLPPGALQIPEGWEADEESLELINNLGAISSLTFQGQDIDIELQEFISGQKTLTTLELVDCNFDEKSDKLSLPASIVNLGLTGSLPPLESFRSLAQVRSLKLSKVNLDKDVAYAIAKRDIQTLELDEVEFTRVSIQRLVNMRSLLRVTMSLCQFELEWLEDVRKKNRSIVVAKPKAFLGVQGPVTVVDSNITGCQISQIVPDKAAAAAGMQALDIVTAVDGQKVAIFEDLRLLISQKRPGESMSIEIRRGDKTLNLKVELGELDEPLR